MPIRAKMTIKLLKLRLKLNTHVYALIFSDNNTISVSLSIPQQTNNHDLDVNK
jgi:hypothetical protein